MFPDAVEDGPAVPASLELDLTVAAGVVTSVKLQVIL